MEAWHCMYHTFVLRAPNAQQTKKQRFWYHLVLHIYIFFWSEKASPCIPFREVIFWFLHICHLSRNLKFLHMTIFSTNIIHGGILWQISGMTVSDNYKGSFEKGQISCSKRSFIVCPKYLINPSPHTNKARLFGDIWQ